MATVMKLEKPEPIQTGLKSEPPSKFAEHDVGSGKDGVPTDSPASIPGAGIVNSGVKGVNGYDSNGKLDVYNPPANGYGYYYPGYTGPFAQMDDQGFFQPDGSLTQGLQPDNAPLLYFYPGYDPYSTGGVVGVDGQQPYYSPGYPMSYGSDAMACYPWDSTYMGNMPNGNTGYGNGKYGPGSNGLTKSNGLNTTKTNGNVDNKFPKATNMQTTRQLNKVSPLGSDFSAGYFKGYQPLGKFSPFNGQKQAPFSPNGFVNYRQNGRVWNGNYRNKPRDRTNRNGDFDNATELACGPRASNRNAPLDPSAKKEDLEVPVSGDQYNSPDFEIEYASAKFYVIKSYNEDDIHKSIKYNVWASTPNGNRKLDEAFRCAQEKPSETAANSPIFLFFSVNGSGQFVGLAEMVGQVDFNKDMDFWQLNKWNGFFPVKWHVVKDIPNNQLRHIILENNENKPVTFSRDTQEIGMKQGLEMLSIFKSYSQKSSLIDDFNFYETREKSLSAKKNSKPTGVEAEAHENGEVAKYAKTGEERSEEDVKIENEANLVDLTKNLTINGCCHPKENAVIEPIENGVAPAAAIVAAAAP
ncbi:YTH domain-containing protein ECT2 [Linum perenne]